LTRSVRTKQLLDSIDKLKNSEVKNLIDKRMGEFKRIGRRSINEIFKELSFCILCANFNAERAIRIQEEISDGFLTLSESELTNKLRKIGYRYPSTRAKYILDARKFKDSLENAMKSFKKDIDLRDWLAKNVTGIGYKEASHFIRNIGHSDCAIIDFHILDILARCGLIEKPKTLSKKKYLEIEDVLRRIGTRSNLNLGELDLYLWYMETGKVLK
jgi:N-glycosylase/DNA lyase